MHDFHQVRPKRAVCLFAPQVLYSSCFNVYFVVSGVVVVVDDGGVVVVVVVEVVVTRSVHFEWALIVCMRLFRVYSTSRRCGGVNGPDVGICGVSWRRL